MTDDQQFILALVTALLPTAASVLVWAQGHETHKLVNGLSEKRVRRAHAAGQVIGRRKQRASDIAEGVAADDQSE